MGRPKGSHTETAKLRAAMKKVSKTRNVNFYERFCEMALDDSSVMVAVMKKMVPDLKQVEVEADVTANLGVVQVPEDVPIGAPVGGDGSPI